MKNAVFFLVTFLLTLFILVQLSLMAQPWVPRCEEDEVIVGHGDFDGRYYDGYHCESWD